MMKKYLLILFSILLLPSVSFASCGSSEGMDKGKTQTKRIDLDSFTQLLVHGDVDVELCHGDEHRVVVYAPQEYIDELNVSQLAQRVMIVRSPKLRVFHKSPQIRVVVTMETLSKLDLQQASRLHSSDRFTTDNMVITVSKASSASGLRIEALQSEVRLTSASRLSASISGKTMISLDAASSAKIVLKDAPTAQIQLDASSRLTLSGSVESLSVSGNYASKISGEYLTAWQAVVGLSNASRCTLSVLGELSYDLAGASRLSIVRGRPRILHAECRSASSFRLL